MSLESFKTDFLISFAWVRHAKSERERAEWSTKWKYIRITKDYISENVFHGLFWMVCLCVYRWMDGWMDRWCSWNDGDDSSHVPHTEFFLRIIITKSFSELIDLVGSAQSAYCFVCVCVCISKNRLSFFLSFSFSSKDHFPSSVQLICIDFPLIFSLHSHLQTLYLTFSSNNYNQWLCILTFIGFIKSITSGTGVSL